MKFARRYKVSPSPPGSHQTNIREKDSGLLGEISSVFFKSDPVTDCLIHDWNTHFAPTVSSHPMKTFNWDVTQSHPFPITGSVTPPLTRFPTTLMVQSSCCPRLSSEHAGVWTILVGRIDGAGTRL